jgi:hypothetical protein
LTFSSLKTQQKFGGPDQSMFWPSSHASVGNRQLAALYPVAPVLVQPVHIPRQIRERRFDPKAIPHGAPIYTFGSWHAPVLYQPVKFDCTDSDVASGVLARQVTRSARHKVPFRGYPEQLSAEPKRAQFAVVD